jgi:hypothetical protein
MRGARGNFSEKELKDFYTKGVPRQGFKFVIKFNSGSFENIAVPYSLLIENPESFKNFRGSGGSSTEVVAFDGNMATLAPHERTLKFHPHFNHGMIDGRHTEEYRILPHNNIADGCLGGYLNLLQKGVIDKSFIAIGLACIGFFTTFNNSDSWGESGVSIYTPEDLYVSEFAEGAVIETVVPLDTTGIQVDPWSPIVYYDFKDKKIKLILEAPEYVKFHLTIRWRGDTVELENQTLEDLAVLNINPYDLISFTINPNLGESTTINVEGMS